MEYYLEGLKQKIFIADGAKWIWNWVGDTYPDSVQIVDFFHAKEHLCEFAKEYFKDKAQREKWIDGQSGNMMGKGIGPVIEAIEDLPEQKRTKKKRGGLLNYYRANEDRMQYHVFKSNGWQIGSGAIEAAHRDVLQQRLKLTGQRWTREGLQQIAQLRVVHKSGQWDRIKKIFKEAA